MKRHTPYSERVLFNWSISHMEFSANLISSICPAVNAIAKSIYMKEGIRGTWTEEIQWPTPEYVFHTHRTLSRISLTLVVVLLICITIYTQHIFHSVFLHCTKYELNHLLPISMNVTSVVYSVKSVGTGKRIQLDGCLAWCESWHIRMPFYYCLVWKKGAL